MSFLFFPSSSRVAVGKEEEEEEDETERTNVLCVCVCFCSEYNVTFERLGYCIFLPLFSRGIRLI